MELCDGENLRSFIDNNKNNNTLIEENNLKKIIMQICIGIKELLNKKIIHRDLKPENIFMYFFVIPISNIQFLSYGDMWYIICKTKKNFKIINIL